MCQPHPIRSDSIEWIRWHRGMERIHNQREEWKRPLVACGFASHIKEFSINRVADDTVLCPCRCFNWCDEAWEISSNADILSSISSVHKGFVLGLDWGEASGPARATWSTVREKGWNFSICMCCMLRIKLLLVPQGCADTLGGGSMAWVLVLLWFEGERVSRLVRFITLPSNAASLCSRTSDTAFLFGDDLITGETGFPHNPLDQILISLSDLSRPTTSHAILCSCWRVTASFQRRSPGR